MSHKASISRTRSDGVRPCAAPRTSSNRVISDHRLEDQSRILKVIIWYAQSGVKSRVLLRAHYDARVERRDELGRDEGVAALPAMGTAMTSPSVSLAAVSSSTDPSGRC